MVISDYRMSVMNGVEFLARVKNAAPGTVRILLTGFADLKTAIEAVNRGNIFRLLIKPFPSEIMTKALVEGIRQYRLVFAERDLLESTLRATIQMLSELLALTKPDAFGLASRIESLARKIAILIKAAPRWEIEVAAALSQIGLFAFSDPLIRKISRGKRLAADEYKHFSEHPRMAADLLARIPRLENVAQIVAYQEKFYDGSGIPDDDIKGEAIPLGARILKLVIDCDVYIQSGINAVDTLRNLKAREKQYDPEILSALTMVLAEEAKFAVQSVSVSGLKERMILAEDIYSATPPRKLLSKGHEVTTSVIGYLKQIKPMSGSGSQ